MNRLLLPFVLLIVPLIAASPVARAQWSGVTPDMWKEISAQRALFDDPNDCQARIAALPSQGKTIEPGADIGDALAANAAVFLKPGRYDLADGQNLVVPAGKKLIGIGEVVIYGGDQIVVQSNAALVNVTIDGARLNGVNFYDRTKRSGSSGALVYRFKAIRTGYNDPAGTGAGGIRVTEKASYNCVVSSSASMTWNTLGAPNANGGNSDGVNNSFGAHHNTFIDVHAFNNGDDGFDMWEGGQSYWYFCDAHDNGKVPGKVNEGDGNGIKLGTGRVAHKFYKTTANDNRTGGFNLNANTVQPVLSRSSAAGNPLGDFMNGTVAP